MAQAPPAVPPKDDLTPAQLEAKLAEERRLADLDNPPAPIEPTALDELPEPEDEPEDELTMDELLERVEAMRDDYHLRVFALVGDRVALEPCGHCGATGLTPAGAEDPELPILDPETIPCTDCNAWGFKRTGGKSPGLDTRPCTSCGGQGWRERPKVEAAAVVDGEPSQPVSASDASLLQELARRQGFVLVPDASS